MDLVLFVTSDILGTSIYTIPLFRSLPLERLAWCIISFVVVFDLPWFLFSGGLGFPMSRFVTIVPYRGVFVNFVMDFRFFFNCFNGFVDLFGLLYFHDGVGPRSY